MIRTLRAFLLFAPALAAAEPFSDGVPARARALDLPVPADGPLEFRGAVVVSPPFPEFGGISGIVAEAGGAVTAVTDTGAWLRLRLRIEGGRLIGIDRAAHAPMLYHDGQVLLRGARDAEGLARDPRDGAFFVSFEGWHRAQRYDRPGAVSDMFFLAPEWEAFTINGGVEALAVDANGALWAIAEDTGETASIWVFGPEDVGRKRLPLEGPYSPTGADFGPDGRLYVTERAFSYFGGFRFRLRRFRFGPGEEPDSAETLLSLGAETRIDNIESVTIWREDGETLLLIASDDNYFALQSNVFALFAVRDGG